MGSKIQIKAFAGSVSMNTGVYYMAVDRLDVVSLNPGTHIYTDFRNGGCKRRDIKLNTITVRPNPQDPLL
jgi:hypothetical protein